MGNRVLFAHAHIDGNTDFPPTWSWGGNPAVARLVIPEKWQGLDKVYLWQLPGATDNVTPTITIDIGICNEDENEHTQTVNDQAYTIVNGQYCCWDLTTIFATVLANLAVGDMIKVSCSNDVGYTISLIGLEVDEL